MADAIDSAGAFLWTHREFLDRYANTAYTKFGSGDGSAPKQLDKNGRTIPVDGGSPPFWIINEDATEYLEQTSDAILEAALALGKHNVAAELQGIVENSVAISRPEYHLRWYPSTVIQWGYLLELDSLILRIKHARVRHGEDLSVQTTENAEKHDLPPAGTDMDMPPAERENAALHLLLLLSQAYYKILESTVATASWGCALDMELNDSYLWVVKNLSNLIKNHEDLQDFPLQFEPILPDLYPSTIRDLDWEDMIAPEVEQFLSAVQQFIHTKDARELEEGSSAWCFVQLFRHGIDSSIERASNYDRNMRKQLKKIFGQTGVDSDSISQNQTQESQEQEQSDPDSQHLAESSLRDEEVAEQVRLLKEMERHIIIALAEHKVVGLDNALQPSQWVIAGWAGYEWDATFKATLSTLVKTKFLGNGRHHGRRGGYFLTPKGERAATIIDQS